MLTDFPFSCYKNTHVYQSPQNDAFLMAKIIKKKQTQQDPGRTDPTAVSQLQVRVAFLCRTVG